MHHLRQGHSNRHVRLREVASASIDRAFEPVLVHLVCQHDHVVLLQEIYIQLIKECLNGTFSQPFTLNPNSPGFSGSKSYSAVQHGPAGFWATTGVLAGDLIGDGNGEARTETWNGITD